MTNPLEGTTEPTVRRCPRDGYVLVNVGSSPWSDLWLCVSGQQLWRCRHRTGEMSIVQDDGTALFLARRVFELSRQIETRSV